MSEPTPIGGATQGGDDLLAELADDYLRRHRAGERPSLDAYAKRHPELADRIRDLFPAVLAMEQSSAAITGVAEAVGATIGRYKLLERIGEGGFGVVYMAEQQHPVRRKVALKVIKPGFDTRQVIARFEAERQALALMDHENIARVLDGGATDSGRPYFVMELVHGVPITDFCDKNQLPPPERLDLFVQVCRAVQHAHTKGIIHRDIKPTNVLVTLHEGIPVPKVIDFGVAKATGQQLTEKTLFTNFAQIVGTPLYMSPEQAEMTSIDVDTRSDVYSLGVLLYELLTGTTPLDKERLKTAAFDEVRRIIREEEPPRPSTRLSTLGDQANTISARRKSDPAQLGRLVRGELDWIVMKALEKDRRQRYETASGLARDIERYLNDEPVQACPPSAPYRLKKFVRRNKGPVLAATLVLLTLVGGIVGTTYGLVRAEQARRAEAVRAEGERRAKQEAQEQAAEARAVLDFVDTKVFAAARPQGDGLGLGHDVTLRRAIEAALPFIETSFADRPLIEARLRQTLGRSFHYLGDAKTGAEQCARARLLYSKHRGGDHPDTLRSAIELAQCYDKLGRHEDALKLREEVLAVRKAALGRDHPDTLGAMHHLATSYMNLRRDADAQQLYEQTLALRNVTLGPEHRDTLWSMKGLAASYAALGRNDEALKLHEQTLALRKAALGPEHPDVMDSMNHVALCYEKLGRRDDALRLREETLALRKAALGPDHPDTLASMGHLANSYGAIGREADALKLRQEMLARRTAKRGLDQPDQTHPPERAESLAMSHRERGRLLCKSSRFRDAVADFEKATELDPEDPWTWYEAAGLYLYVADVERYRGACRQMLDRFEKLAADEPRTASIIAKACALAPGSVTDFSRPERLAERCVTGTETHDHRRWFMQAKVLTDYRAGRDEQAIDWLKRFAPKPDGTHWDGTAFAVQAMVRHRLGHADEARASLHAARAILAKKPPDAMHGWSWRDWLHCEILLREAEQLLAK